MPIDWSRPELESRFRNVVVTHAALILSVGVYVFAAWQIASRPGFAFERPPLATAAAAGIATAALLAALAGIALPVQIARRLPEDAAAALARWGGAQLLRGVMFEIVGVAGLVIVLLGGSMAWLAGLAAASGALLALAWPRRAAFEERWAARGRS